MFKLELKYKKFKLEQEEGGSMFDEQWQFAVEVEREYAQYRKKVMMRYHLSAAEVDILLFLANNSQFDCTCAENAEITRFAGRKRVV